MKERDVRRAVEEQDGLMPDVPPVSGQVGARNAPELAKRKAEDEWLAFAVEDPAFFIKPSDTA